MPLRRGADGSLGVAASGGGGGASAPTNVNVSVINNHPGASVGVQQRQRPDGGVDIVAMVKSTMNDHLASGGADGIMRARFGAQIRPRAR
jgi:phage-related minor tail protein